MSNYYDPSEGDRESRERLRRTLEAQRQAVGAVSKRITRKDPVSERSASRRQRGEDHSYDPVHMWGGGLVKVGGRDSYLPTGHTLTLSYRVDPHSRWQGSHTKRVEALWDQAPLGMPERDADLSTSKPRRKRERKVETDANPRILEASPGPFGDVPMSAHAAGRFALSR